MFIVNCPLCSQSQILGCIYPPHYPEHCSVCGYRLRERSGGLPVFRSERPSAI
jgi:hypothetical protein